MPPVALLRLDSPFKQTQQLGVSLDGSKTQTSQPESLREQVDQLLAALRDSSGELAQRARLWVDRIDVRGYIDNPDHDRIGAPESTHNTVSDRVLHLMTLFASGINRENVLDQLGAHFLLQGSPGYSEFRGQFDHFWTLAFDGFEEFDRPGNSTTSPERLKNQVRRLGDVFDLALDDASKAKITVSEGVHGAESHVTYNDNMVLFRDAIELSHLVPVADKEAFDKRLKEGVKTIDIRFKFTKDDGAQVDVAFIRVQNNISRGPAKGGIRAIIYNPNDPKKPNFKFEDEVAEHFGDAHFLSSGMSRKNAVADVPYGGGKGEIIFPVGLSLAERKRLFFTVGLLMAPYVGETQDVPAPDVGTGGPDMAAFRAGVELRTEPKPGVITGKPLEAGGIAGRPEATGAGGEKAIDLALKQAERMWDSVVAVVQGFGNVGNEAALRIVRNGGKVVAISDHSATLVNDNGISQEEIEHHRDAIEAAKKKNQGYDLATARQFEGTRKVLQPGYSARHPELDLPVDGDALFRGAYNLVVPAAKEDAITEAQAALIGNNQSVIVASLANSPMRRAVITQLEEQGAYILPDIFANIGGVVVSFLEWVKNIYPRWDAVVNQMPQTKQGEMQRVWRPVADQLAQNGWQAPEVLSVMKKIMDFSFEDMTAVAKEYDVKPTMAAELLAVNRLYLADTNKPELDEALVPNLNSYTEARVQQLVLAATPQVMPLAVLTH